MIDSAYDAILDNLFIGSKDALDEHSNNEDNPFHFIVNCTVNIPFPKYSMPLQLRIPIDDDTDDSIKFLEMMVYTNVLEKIYKCICQKQKVLVYSNFGQQRSCALAACFLIKYLKIKPIQAIKYVCSKRKEAFLSDNHFEHTIHFYYEYLKLEKENRLLNRNNKFFQKIDENKKKDVQPII